ncbi:multidrug effflux MFS transporter [Wenxinia saemankumensis]|uniref:MFS transporter, DHA1 family, bicyclomycin/chloramphenicol resistance protein n=1 Tax=Wenxinia saemankumensis TaxID=1447782 RepID=A0A1M6A6C7_9RHOB|nr:multidrug effflux MFS transporter [Wenxinia saemankumensis]SHI32031.1 MFS transporter, DHA1 family, bicyclomycin/chloramphenicol resistance protein [Wenxinia saemankumensis]
MTDATETDLDRPAPPGRRLSRPEFVGMTALLFAIVAFSIDSMLPALPDMAAELTPDDPNRAQLILTAFVFGMGLGTFAAGPLSDALGRKAIINGGIALYIVGALLASVATSLETLLAARVLQGLGAAGPRIAILAMVRDLYGGRRMAQIMSFVMMVFILIPAAAPSVGVLITDGFGWRALFIAYCIFAVVASSWFNLRQPETLPPGRRRPVRIGTMRSALKEVFSQRVVVIYLAVLTLGFGQMFALLSSIAQIYVTGYDMEASFPVWFLIGGLLSGVGTVSNAGLVMRLGMRRIAIFAYAMLSLASLALLALEWTGVVGELPPFGLFFAWQVIVLAAAGLTFGNLNALALEPLGHIAGLASSVIGAVSTVLAVAIAAPIGLMFDGTPTPLLWGVLVCSVLAFVLMRASVRIDPERSGAD